MFIFWVRQISRDGIRRRAAFATLGRTVFVSSNETPDVVVDSLEADVLLAEFAQCWL